jgi:L-threonine kinase
MEAVSVFPGSCGEIIQGNYQGTDMLVSCPVTLFTIVRVMECKQPVHRFKYKKSSALLDNILKRWGYGDLSNSFDIDIRSSIPVGKGFAGSTADLCGVYISLLKLFNRKYDISEVIEEFIKIEPTDSIIFRGMTLFDYKKGKNHQHLGPYMKFYILAFEGKKMIDTISFNNRKLPPLMPMADTLALLKEGIRKADIAKIALSSTLSIERNFPRLPYDVYQQVKDIMLKTGGLGIIGAHSGDLLGIIYDDRERFLYAKKYGNSIPGYMPHFLETLEGYEYDLEYGCSWDAVM